MQLMIIPCHQQYLVELSLKGEFIIVMDSMEQQSEGAVSSGQSMSGALSRCTYCLYSCIADFFECDRRFQAQTIIPYQIHHIKNQNPLTQQFDPKNPQSFSFQTVPTDSTMVEPIEANKWEEIKTWAWWKRFLCCPYSEDQDLDFATDYDLQEPRFVSDKKQNGEYLHNINEKDEKEGGKLAGNDDDDIIFLNDDMLDDGISEFSMPKSENPVMLYPQPVKVMQRIPIQEVGIKKISKRSLHIDSINNDLETEVFSPIRKHSGYQSQHKISNDFALDEPSQSNNLHTNGNQNTSQINTNAKIESFDGSHSDHPNIKKPVPSTASGHIQSGNEETFQQQLGAPQDIAQDKVVKRKRRYNNPFDSSAIAEDDLCVTQQNPPQDLSKKRRRKKKEVKQEERERQQRANRRDQQELQVVIFEDQG